MRRSIVVICLLSVSVAVHGEDPGTRAQALGFVKLLGDKDLGGVAESSLTAMGENAVPALSFALKDLASSHRTHAAKVLGAIGGDAAQTALRSAVGERDPSVRVAA
ncbi:MAG: hypothetical protein OER88_11975, partial [Planctomycetota bacterium]|nr:hypothetical protein [Planctomycetota bacterium]